MFTQKTEFLDSTDLKCNFVIEQLHLIYRQNNKIYQFVQFELLVP